MNRMSLSCRRYIKQIGDRRSKGHHTKTGDGRNQMNSSCLGNHSDDAGGSDSGVFTDFQEMFWDTIP